MSLFKANDVTTTNKPAIVVFKAKNYKEAQDATLQLKRGKAVLIDLTALTDIELLKGYASLEEACNLLTCQLRAVSTNIYLLTPTNFEVVAEPDTAKDDNINSAVKNKQKNDD